MTRRRVAASSGVRQAAGPSPFLLAGVLALAVSCGEPAGETQELASSSAALSHPPADTVWPAVGPKPNPAQNPQCARVIKADVVALDQVYTYNRFGAYNPTGMLYALRRDVEAIDASKPMGPGNVRLRLDKRPRPLALRANVGDCLQVNFTNWLAPDRSSIPSPSQSQPTVDQVSNPSSGFAVLRKALATWVMPVGWLDTQESVQSVVQERAVGGLWFWPGQEAQFDSQHKQDSPATRNASVHIQGLQYRDVPNINDGANVGMNTSSLVAPGASHTYNFYADKEGAFFMYSMGASFGGQGDGGSLAQGLFGAVNVEPKGARWYRSKVSAQVLAAAQRGVNPDGTPRIDYEARDSQGRPLLNILDETRMEIWHGDLEAIITGYQATSVGTFTSKDQGHFREITAIYHDQIKAVQAFDELEWNRTFHSVRDGFGINYGVAGLGAELLANRAKIGPSKNCGDCEYEEFFLESWANGDPALNVEKDWRGNAVRALYPDDPSNVHHSYLGDPVRIRNIHAGPAETHVFHLHAHQWKYSPGVDDSNYLDSQTIGPGSSFTYDINYGGSGNRNLTPGDSIHHCHLYPHFAQGMWALWRVHDVFEDGSAARKLPDGEIAQGTPNPAVIPIPSRGMPPMPTYADSWVTNAAGQQVLRPAFPGYPFYVAGRPGARPPQAPMDLQEDGGLPRHIVTRAIGPSTYGLPGKRFYVDHHALDLKLLPANGTPLEQKAMSFHGGSFPDATFGPRPYYTSDTVAAYPAFTAAGSPASFYVNGRRPVPGAPFADPCPPSAPLRTYRASYVDVPIRHVNREGWWDPQGRIMVLDEDVAATQSGARPPEPFFFRANSGECINFYASNLANKDLQADDFQIWAPTDTIGQHIHLVKFDVMASDGAGNGWNYEDGTFAPDKVIEVIAKANNAGGAFVADGSVEPVGARQLLSVRTHPRLGRAGAQTTTQRWWADPLENALGQERPIETVFTHDHFGPSNHQQHGLYGALIIEPKGSTWRSPSASSVVFGTRADGGPTSWAAVIEPPNKRESFREYSLAFADYALLYEPQCGTPVAPPNYKEESLPKAVGFESVPLPEAISAADPGTMLVNYRNEPIPLRISAKSGCGPGRTVHPGKRGDMANVFSSVVHGDPFTPLLWGFEGDKAKIRLIQGAQEEQHSFTLHGHTWLREEADPHSGFVNAQALGISEHFEFNLTKGLRCTEGNADTCDFMYQGASSGDLWNGLWGIMRVYNKQRTRWPFLVDHLFDRAAHQATLPVSEFEFREKVLGQYAPRELAQLELPLEARMADVDPQKDPANFQESWVVDDKGTPLFQREIEYALEYPDLMRQADTERRLAYWDQLQYFSGPRKLLVDSCPAGSPVRVYQVTAIDARTHLPGKRLVYNQRFDIYDPDAVIFVRNEHLADVKSGRRKPEPLILRARAGECVQVTLTNLLPKTLARLPHWAHHSPITDGFNVNQVPSSNHVSLHPQLVRYEVNVDDGANVGLNAHQTVPAGGVRTYKWYTGDFQGYYPWWSSQLVKRTPVEFGLVNLRNMADVVNHGMHGSIGALVVEPAGAQWTEDAESAAQARVRYQVGGKEKVFRELVLLFQDDLGLHSGKSIFAGGDAASPTALRNIKGVDDSQDTGLKAFNYRTEPLWARLSKPPQTDPETLNDFDLTHILSTGIHGDPETPLFTAYAGEELRMRVGHPSGHARQHAFALHGAEWQANAWAEGASSLVMGPNGKSPIVSTQGGMSVMQAWNFNPLYGAGGAHALPGDYLYRDLASFQWSGGGLWGVLRVEQKP